MDCRNRVYAFAYALLNFAIGLLVARSAIAQVSPGEIANPKFKAAEQQYLPQPRSLQHATGETQLPLPFVPTAHVGVDPARQALLDPRGLYFQNRIPWKTSGICTATFNSQQLTQDERVSKTFQDIFPILRLIVHEVPADMLCFGVGWETTNHARVPRKDYDYEWREILAVD